MTTKKLIAFVFLLSFGAIVFFFFPGRKGNKMHEKTTIDEVPPQAAVQAVSAIYAFKNKNGLWPFSLQELIPEFLDPSEKINWLYQWRPDYCKLIDRSFLPEFAWAYEFDGEDSCWKITDGVNEKKIDFAQPLPKKLPINTDMLLRRRNALILRRIQEFPKALIHYKGQISISFKEERFKDAFVECQRCLERWPDHWWPNVMMSSIEKELGMKERAENRLVQRAKKTAIFSDYFFLWKF